MPIVVTCACGRSYPIREEFAGQRVQCPACNQLLTIPGISPESPLPLELDALDTVDETDQAGAVHEPRVAARRGGLLVLLGLLAFLFVFCTGLGAIAVLAIVMAQRGPVAALSPTSPPGLQPPEPSPPDAEPPPGDPIPPAPRAPDVQDLVAKLDDADAKTRLDAARQLRDRGAEVRPFLPVLVKALERDDSEFRAEVLAVLGKIGRLTPAEADQLGPLLNDRSFPAGRVYALETLAALGADHPATLPAIKEALSDKDPEVRHKAVQLAGKLGPDAHEALYPALLAMLTEDDPKLTKEVADALAKMGKPTPKDLAELNDLLRNSKPAARRFALLALADMGPEAAKALPRITETFAVDRDPDLRRLALMAAAKLQTDKKELTALLKRGLMDPDPEVNKQAVTLLAALAPDGEAVAAFLQALNHADDRVVKTAEGLLPTVAWNKTHARALVATLRANKSDRIRLRLAHTLVAIRADTPDAGLALKEFLQDAQGETRVKVVMAIGDLGTAGADAGPLLADYLKDPDKALRFEAAAALCKTRSDQASRAVPLLVAALRVEPPDDKEGQERQEKAHQALVQLGKPGVEELAKSLEKEFFGGNPKTPAGAVKADARAMVIKTLDMIGADAKDAAPALAACEKEDPVPANRQAAHHARLKVLTAAGGK
jgi:HEAT repeat protein